jgi:hypothetical protein
LDVRRLLIKAKLLEKVEVREGREAKQEEEEDEKGDPVFSSRPSAATGGGVVPLLFSEDKVVRRLVDWACPAARAFLPSSLSSCSPSSSWCSCRPLPNGSNRSASVQEVSSEERREGGQV